MPWSGRSLALVNSSVWSIVVGTILLGSYPSWRSRCHMQTCVSPPTTPDLPLSGPPEGVASGPKRLVADRRQATGDSRPIPVVYLQRRICSIAVIGNSMSAKRKVKDALSAVEDAQRALRRAADAAPDEPNIGRAIRELREAQTLLERAAREVGRLESQ